jgi:hypothetical protein
MKKLETRVAVTILSLALSFPAMRAQDAHAPTLAQAPAPQVTATTAQGGTVKGTVIAGAVGKPGGIALPGVAVTATHTLTGKKYTTSTDIDGNYAMTLPKTGRYVIRAELMGFAAATQEVVIAAADAGAEKKAEFGLELASRAAATAAQAETTQAGGQTTGQRQTGSQGGRGQGGRTLGGRGAVSLDLGDSGLDATDASVGGGNAGINMPSLGGLGDSSDANGGDAIAVSGGAPAQMNGLAGISEDELRNRVQDAVAQAQASGMIPQGGDPTNAIVGMLGPMMAGGGPGGGGRGGFGGGGGGGRGGRGGGGGGAFRNFNPAQPHGSMFYRGNNSALNASQWLVNALDTGPHFTANPSAYSNQYGLTFGSSPYIPFLTKPNTKQFVFINLTGQKNLNAFAPSAVRVPTLLERTGNFSQSQQLSTSTAGSGSTAVPVAIYNPATGAQFANNTIPRCSAVLTQGCISPQALALLNYYPAPNLVTSNPTAPNYQTISNAGTNNVAINTRYNRTLGQATNTPFGRFGGGAGGGGRRGQNQNAPPQLRQTINASYNYSHSAADNRNIFLALGGTTESDGNALSAGYTVGYGRLSNNATLTWNRLDSKVKNDFTDTATNPSTLAGLSVPNRAGGFADPNFYNGLATISITNYGGLSNQTPSQTTNQTISFSDFVSWRHKKHNMRYGFDIRRVHNDQIGGSNPLGRYNFTGYATETPSDQTGATSTGSGSGFADFLLGLPQSTSIQAGLYKIYLRENVYDWYVQDDFRVAPGLTLNYGLRYEYFAPYTEKNNRLVNLDHNPNFTAVDTVMPGGNSTYQGKYNSSVVNPDRTMYAPRIGVAYVPPKKHKLFQSVVVRGGYAINYNTGMYTAFAQSLSHQVPFAVTQTNTVPTAAVTNASGCTTTQAAYAGRPATTANMTLGNGFGCSTQFGISNNYAVDKNYRLGMVQIYNLNIQKTLPLQTVFNVGYNGTYGNKLDIYGTPNATATGSTIASVAPFDYETSGATLHSNQLVVSLQKRQQKGIQVGATYTYGHSIDDASQVGNGAARTPMQNFYNLRGERSNSSTDVRHSVTGTWIAELPFGPNRAFFNKGGKMAKALDGLSLSGNFTFSSGSYYTPTYSDSTQEAAAGNTYTQRADRAFGVTSVGAGTLARFFNTAAFTKPAGSYGTASRYSIQGPGVQSLTASLSRTIQFKGTNSFEARITASNVFNTVQYTGIGTTVDLSTFGQVTGAASMRGVQYQARYRF